MPAISRGLGEARALPPDTKRKYPDPGPGSQAFHSREAMTSGLASLQAAISSWLAFRWYRCARPPANRSEPFRFWGHQLHHAILSGRARVCKAQGNSEFEESPGWPPLAPLYSIENSEEPISRGPSKLESAAKYSNHAKTSTLSCISRGSRLRFISWSFRTGLCKSLISRIVLASFNASSWPRRPKAPNSPLSTSHKGLTFAGALFIFNALNMRLFKCCALGAVASGFILVGAAAAKPVD